MNIATTVAASLTLAGITTAALLVSPQKVVTNTVSIPVLTLPAPSLTALPKLTTREIEKITVPSEQVVRLFGVVDKFSTETLIKDITEKSKEGKDLYLLIDSPGGSVLDGARIVSTMEASKVKIHTVCIRMCASMAFIIHQYGTTRLAHDRAMLMGHPASAGLEGTLEQMSSRLNALMTYVDKLDAPIAVRVGMSLESFKALTVSELWIDSEDSLKRHLLDKIVYIDTNLPRPVLLSPLLPQERQKDAFPQFDANW